MKRRLGVLILIGVACGLAAMLYACVPVTQRLTSPVTCPSGTVESVVVAWETSSGSGRTSAHSRLICVDGDGGGTEPSGPKTFAVLLGYASLLVGVSFFGGRTIVRMRGKQPQP